MRSQLNRTLLVDALTAGSSHNNLRDSRLLAYTGAPRIRTSMVLATPAEKHYGIFLINSTTI